MEQTKPNTEENRTKHPKKTYRTIQQTTTIILMNDYWPWDFPINRNRNLPDG
jgi:hypothetical protein